MTDDAGYPPSLLLDGPLFRDELAVQPQHFEREHDLERLRLVPSKSAASGVYTIYFSPEHRQWALVRLASRYRGLFEVQLNRGMSGEHQLLNQGFSSDDIEFLLDIVPQPPTAYNPIVYDMLWLVATYEEYLALARAMAEQDTFTPRDLLRSTDGVDIDDDGFFTRFLRSHLIQPVDAIDDSRGPSRREKATTTADLGTTYEVTNEGSEALAGIVEEYDRIFERQEFEPLRINPDLDPRQHVEAYTPKPDGPSADVSLEELQDESGILSEIASAFAPSDDEAPSPDSSAEQGAIADPVQDSGDQHGPDGNADEQTAGQGSGHSESNSRDSSTGKPTGTVQEEAPTPEDALGATPDRTNDDTAFESFTRAEVLRAATTAATLINDETVIRTSAVKTAVWESVDLDGRDRGALWNLVGGVLMEMSSVQGRVGGHVWAATGSNST